MKKMKLFFALAILIAVGSAFAAPKAPAMKSQIYVAIYGEGENFTWQELEGSFNECDETDLSRNCFVSADALPAANTTPAGTVKGEYIP